MLFLIRQTHHAESCPKESGGSKTLYDASAEGVRLRAVYGAYAEHVIYYLIEADDLQAIHRFLLPGFMRCTCDITPVSEEPIIK